MKHWLVMGSVLVVGLAHGSWNSGDVWTWNMIPPGSCQETRHGLAFGTPECRVWGDCPITEYEMKTGVLPTCRGGVTGYRLRWSQDPCVFPKYRYTLVYTDSGFCDYETGKCGINTVPPKGQLTFLQITPFNDDGECGGGECFRSEDGSGECRHAE